MRSAKTHRWWTRTEECRLESLRLSGLTREQIAAKLGRTFHSIACRLAQQKILLPRRDARYLPLLTRPHRIMDVAAELGVSRWAVHRAKLRLRRAGFSIPAALRVPRGTYTGRRGVVRVVIQKVVAEKGRG